ncbi:MAG: ABC transporter ATP-binding protein [Planctomycetes bacterium]|nr:ABC transporter ATP-binding protein [Planctomycetota bacterium]
MKLLKCEGASYAYPGGTPAVDGASLSVEQGRFVCIIGPNGAGKSTLLKGMAGLLPLDRGDVTVDGVAVSGLGSKARARTLALVPQFLDAIPPLTVASFVMGGRYGHLDSWRRADMSDYEAVGAALKAAHVEELGERLLGELSGGQRQRVLIARALAQEAGYLLVDEPTSSLDPEHQLGVFNLLRELARSGRGVCVVTHDLNLASQFADEVALMRAGSFAAMGCPTELLTPEVLEPVYGAHFRFASWGAGDGEERPVVVPWAAQ